MRAVWKALVSKDHWQGEFCVCLFGIVGFVILDLVLPQALERSSYWRILDIMPGEAWDSMLLAASVLQIYGLVGHHLHARLIGALVNFAGLVAITFAILSSKAIPLGMAMFLACAVIEGLAVVFLTAESVRMRGRHKWTMGQS